MSATIYDKIAEADLILVGLGEEFNVPQSAEYKEKYKKYRELLLESGRGWMLPALISYLNEEEKGFGIENVLENDLMYKGLCRLAELLQNKNYFIVSVSVNDKIACVPWKEGRLVAPCGTGQWKQCESGCENTLEECSQEEKAALHQAIRRVCSAVDREGILDFAEAAHQEGKTGLDKEGTDAILGSCPECGKPMVLNNIYAEHYNEKGYLSQWALYTKWLQGTLNKKILLLELGVGMQFPSVIRWPFEKIAFFQKKAEFYRVNARLYHMSEELKGKGTAIPSNAVDWLGSL